VAKVRSPNYPTISLRDAVARIQVVYAKEHKHPVEREVVAKHLGYGGLNGASMSVISALSKYGLVEQVGDQLRVSSRGEDVCLYAQHDPERVQALVEAAFSPVLFNELRDIYGERLPSDQNLRAFLVKRGFNPRTVDGVIRSYRDTIEFLNEESGGSYAESEGVSQSEKPMTTPIQTNPSPRSGEPQAMGLPGMLSNIPGSGFDELVLWFKLSEEAEVRAAFKGRVTQEAIRKFIQLLEVSLDTFPSKLETKSRDPLDANEHVA
jgi:hypothetical protein